MKNFRDILKKDRALNDEVNQLLDSGTNLPVARRFNIGHTAIKKAMVGPRNELPRAEAMVQLHLRPVLLIRNNKIEAPASAEIRRRFMPFVNKLNSHVPSVGRIDFKKAGKLFGGTGWLIDDDIIVTNRHVAQYFAETKGKTIVFRKNFAGDYIDAYIDFKEEFTGKDVATSQYEVPVQKVLYMTSKDTDPDVAFLKIQKHAKLSNPIPVSDIVLKKSQFISIVGYPAYDPDGIISEAAATKVFGDIYNVKRCSPGEVMEYEKNTWYFSHDCTTLGGNSGSVVLDNNSGLAVGLHFKGEVEEENFAIKASEVIKQLRKIKTKVIVSTPTIAEPVKKGKPEGTPEDFANRKGFNVSFLGKKFNVPLPKVSKNKNHELSFTFNGKKTTELKYQNFTVVMNKERRLCFFSACNIDGKLSKRGVARTSWKYDPRIEKKYQVKDECYGNAPKFSRGHMTRKEDPIWGDMATAKTACKDTFTVPNATPQMQHFNAPTWLALEDYALENSRQDEMKISVITGPIFASNDPVKYGVKIPVQFFKIIAFIHDETGKLCATGYTVSQKDDLSDNEFVYGEFETYQVSIKTIERKTGLSFGKLSSFDALHGNEFAGGALNSLSDIVFV